MNVLVTGGAGFVGSHLVARLVTDGHHVRVLDNLSTGRRENLDRISGDFEFIKGDLRSPGDLRKAVEGVEVVFHEGALPSVPRSIADPRTCFDVNVTGTLNLLLAAHRAGARRIVFASSSSVYGNATVPATHEELTPCPLSPYAISKLTGEQLCTTFYQLHGLETVCLRYFNVFGPYQDPDSTYAAVIPKFLWAISVGDRPVIYGDGEQSRGFTYVDDVVQGNVLAATSSRAAGQIMNLACDHSVSVNYALDTIFEILGSRMDVDYRPARPGDIRFSLADITRARDLLGFECSVSFEDGIARTVDAFGLIHAETAIAIPA